MRALLEDRISLAPGTAVAALVAVIGLSGTGWQLLRWSSAMNAEENSTAHAPVVTGADVDPLPVILSANLFGRPASDASGAAAGVQPDVETTGYILRAAFAGAEGAGGAIIESSGGQAQWYNVGQAVEPGLFLREVRPDHVVLDRSGRLETLSFARLADIASTQATASGGLPESAEASIVDAGENQPIPSNMPAEEKAVLIRQRLEELRNRTRQ